MAPVFPIDTLSASCMKEIPYWIPGTCSTRSTAPVPSAATLYVPASKIQNPVQLHTRSVSIYTESPCTSPCFTGWEVSVVAEISGLIPFPASFEKKPLLIPHATADPTIPPNIASFPNALAKIEPNIPGISL